MAKGRLGDWQGHRNCGRSDQPKQAVGETPARYVVANKFADVLARV
jgi:hypothetical protein